MTVLNRIWKHLSQIGANTVFDERQRFEIITINQLSVLAFLFSLLGMIPIYLQSPFGPAQAVAIGYSLLFLISLFWHSIGWHFTAKITPILNVSIFCILLGLAFGLESEAHTIFLILIAFTILFFYRSPIWLQAILIFPLVTFPIGLLILDSRNDLPLFDPGITLPDNFGISTFILTALISIFFFNLIIKNFRHLIKELNEKRFALLNENARSKGTAQGMEEKLHATIHDLKSPLTSALELIQIIETTAYEEERSKALKFLHQSLNRMKYQVDSMMEEGDFFDKERESQPIDLRQELQEILNMISHYPGYDRMRIEVDIDQPAPIMTDRNCLRVVLSNILSNSIKYKDIQKSRPFTRIIGIVESDEYIIKIEDNGIGIAEKDLPNIFKKKYRATDQAEGNGIGLALVKRALDILDGRVVIESELGEGTTVTIHLPHALVQNGMEQEASLN